MLILLTWTDPRNTGLCEGTFPTSAICVWAQRTHTKSSPEETLLQPAQAPCYLCYKDVNLAQREVWPWPLASGKPAWDVMPDKSFCLGVLGQGCSNNVMGGGRLTTPESLPTWYTVRGLGSHGISRHPKWLESEVHHPSLWDWAPRKTLNTEAQWASEVRVVLWIAHPLLLLYYLNPTHAWGPSSSALPPQHCPKLLWPRQHSPFWAQTTFSKTHSKKYRVGQK